MKLLKWVVIGLVTLVLAGETYILISGKIYLNTLFPYTIFSGRLNPDIDELDWFKRNTINTTSPQAWPRSARYNRHQFDTKIEEAFLRYQTVSYLVVKDDSVLYEKQWENYSDSTPLNSFSMAKSITSMLIGCALNEHLLQSVDQPVADFLEEFKQGNLQKITIRHLLTMSSGLAFREDYSSMFSWPAEAYYGPDVNDLTLKQAVPEIEPGKTWKYKGGDTQLLGMILKKVTGKTVAQYASEKLWEPIAAEFPAFWSLDEKGMEKVSCCWYATARDFARLAKLMMQFGKWNGQTIIDSAYVSESLTPPAELRDKDGKQTRQYGFQWWLMEHKNHSIFYMRGIRGQYVFAIPDAKMIVVRLGHKRASKQGDELPEDIYLYLDEALKMAGY